MDISNFLEVKAAPRWVFDSLPERKTRVRFMLPTPEGDWRAVTWGAFATQIRRCALFLSSVGVKSGDRGAIFAPNSVEWLSAALAIQTAGGVMVPIYPASTTAQAAYVANHCDAKVLFVDTPALLMRVFEAWSDYGQAVRIVTLGEKTIEAGPLLEKMRAEGRSCPSAAEVEKKLIPWSRVMALGAARDAESAASASTTKLGNHLSICSISC